MLAPCASMIVIMFEQVLASVPGVRPIHLGAGDLIFRQGEAVTAIFQVKDGSVAMLRHLSDGALLTVATAGAGETFAEAALFSEHYHCDAIARTKAEILSAPSVGLRRLLASDPQLAIEFAAFLARQVRELRTRLEIQRIKRAPDRLMAWLHWRARGEKSVEAPDAWSRVASELALTPEALYRALSQLEKSGLISRRGRQILFHSASER